MTKDTSVTRYTRREILKLGLGALTALMAPGFLVHDNGPTAQSNRRWLRNPAPAPLGRIISWQRQAVRREPTLAAPLIAWKSRNTVIPL